MQVLNDFYNLEGDERIGFILGNKITEVRNISSSPKHTFMVSAEDIIEYAEKADGFWHTHPGATCNLSSEDTTGIQNWPKLKHYIVGRDGVKCYSYNEDKKVILEEDYWPK